jgi:hypothetical protein
MIRRFIATFFLLLFSVNAGRADLILSDVQVWAGSGSNEAGFVADWGNGNSYAFGYRWNGTATGADMLQALANANVGLYTTVQNYGGSLGLAVYGMGYDLNKNGIFGTTPPLTFVNGIATLTNANQTNDSRTASDPGDLYTEGWFTSGYWADWTLTDPTAGWTSGNGLSSDVLSNGEFLGLAFAPGFNANPPADPTDATPAAVPEPGPIMLLSTIGIVALVAGRVRKWSLCRHRLSS